MPKAMYVDNLVPSGALPARLPIIKTVKKLATVINQTSVLPEKAVATFVAFSIASKRVSTNKKPNIPRVSANRNFMP